MLVEVKFHLPSSFRRLSLPPCLQHQFRHNQLEIRCLSTAHSILQLFYYRYTLNFQIQFSRYPQLNLLATGYNNKDWKEHRFCYFHHMAPHYRDFLVLKEAFHVPLAKTKDHSNYILGKSEFLPPNDVVSLRLHDAFLEFHGET